MSREKPTTGKTALATVRTRAERVINATGAFSATFRAEVRAALDEPKRLRALVIESEEINRERERLVNAAHTFCSEVHTAAVRFYYANHADPAKLEAFRVGFRKLTKGGAR